MFRADTRAPGILVLASLASLLAPNVAPAQATRNVTVLSQVDLHTFSTNSWAYIHPDGREYVAVGTKFGTAIFRLTDPNNPAQVGFIPGASSTTRDVDQYQTYIYSMSAYSGNDGIQIISMADPDNPVLAKTVHGIVENCENITVDSAHALLFTCRSDADGGYRIISIADPLNPVLLYAGTTYEVHDITIQGTTAFASSLIDNTEHIIDISNPAAPQEITSFSTGISTHSAWPSADGRYLYLSNENLSGGELVVYDIQNLAQPVEVYRSNLVGISTLHYTRVLGNRLYVSHYSGGVRILDLSNPAWPVESAYLDTYLGDDAIVTGAYDTCPFYPSGIVTASDRVAGLFVFRVNAPDYGLVRGMVRDTSGRTPVPLAGALVRVLPNGPSTITTMDGRYGLAPTAGLVGMQVTKYSYATQSAQVGVAVGSDQAVDFQTAILPTGSIKGTVVRASDQIGLDGAEVSSPGTPLISVTSGHGAYSLTKVPAASTLVRADRPGFVPVEATVNVVAKKTATLNFALSTAAFYDDIEADRGWTVGAPGDDATAGQWVRAVPIGTTDPSNGEHPQPDADHTPSPGTQCFVTANGVSRGDANAADVDGGKTTLTSPSLPLGSIQDPRIAFWRWLYSSSRGPGPSPFLTQLSNDDGATWTTVDSAQAPPTQSFTQTPQQWERVELRVQDYFSVPGTMRVRFIAQDRFTSDIIVEASVDDFEYYSGTLAGSAKAMTVVDAVETRPTLTVRPLGRLRGGLAFEVRSDRDMPRAVARLFDVNGRLVRTLLDGTAPSGATRLVWDSRTDQGGVAAAGVYLLRVDAGQLRSETKAILLH